MANTSTPTLESPNVDNLQVGKGIVSFKKTGDADYRDMGNVSELVITPEVDTLEHFSSREGTKKKDLVIILEQKCTAKITMEEITADNLALMVYGNVDEAAVGGPEVEIFANSAITGALRFTGTNDVGPQITVDLYNVSFQPSGDLTMISDEFNNMEVTCDVLAAGGVAPIAATGIYTASVNLLDTTTLVIGGKTYTLQDTLTDVDGHVKIGANLPATLLNLLHAINASGGVSGTDYGASTVANATVKGVSSSATTLNVAARTGGTAGNAITTTDTASGAWGAGTLSGGVAGNANAGKFGVAKFTNVAPAS